MLKCDYCGEEFFPNKHTQTSQRFCSSKCRKASEYIRNKNTYKEYRRTHKEQDKIYDRNYCLSLKKRVIFHYSNGLMKCMNPECEVKGGARDIRSLSIDHLNNGGCKHRRDIGKNGGQVFYKWLIDSNYPEGYQVLCMNCQFIKRVVSK